MTKFVFIKNAIFNADKIISIEHQRIKYDNKVEQFLITVKIDDKDSTELRFSYDNGREMLDSYRKIMDQLRCDII